MLTDTVQQLRSHKSDLESKIASLQSEIGKIDEAIAALVSVGDGSAPAAATVHLASGKTRTISAAGIARIRAAQKLRWSKFKKNGGGETATKSSGRAKPVFSAAGIARIRAAQKARWAKYNAEKAKK
jgi:hypothetical protein